jgi:hypothetical protein
MMVVNPDPLCPVLRNNFTTPGPLDALTKDSTTLHLPPLYQHSDHVRCLPPPHPKIGTRQSRNAKVSCIHLIIYVLCNYHHPFARNPELPT